MRKVILVLIIAGAAAAAIYLGGGTGEQARKPGVEKVLALKTTVGFAGLEGPEKLVAQIDDIAKDLVKVLPAEIPNHVRMAIDPKLRSQFLGFDPATAEGWKTLGIDPGAGLYIVGDSVVIQAGQRPIFLLKITDRAKLAAVLAKFDLALTFSDKKGPSEIMSLGGRSRFLVGKRGDYTALMPVGGRKVRETRRNAFNAFLEGGGPDLTTKTPLSQATKGPAGDGRGVGLLSAQALVDMMKGKARVDPTDLDYYASRFPAAGFVTGDGGVTARLVASAEGHGALVKLFKPKVPPNLSKYVPSKGWMAVRLSVNLEGLFAGIAEFIPPSKAQMRAMLPMAQAAFAMQTGIPYDTLVKALTGHVLFGIDLSYVMFLNPRKPPPGRPKFIAAIGVNDEAAADLLIKTAIDLLAKQRRGPGMPATVKVAGATGHQWNIGPLQPVLVRVGKVIFIAGSTEAIEAAIKRSTGKNLSSTAAGKVIDDPNSFYVGAVDSRDWLQSISNMVGNSGSGKEAVRIKSIIDKHVAAMGADNLAFGSVGLDQGLRVSVSGGASMTAMAGILAAIAIPSFLKYQGRAKTLEANMNLRKLFDSSIAYFNTEHADRTGKILAPQFPVTTPLTPGNPTKYMCQDGKPIKFQPDAKTFDDPTWQALNFAVHSPFRFAYQYTANGSGAGSKFVARAVGDLDCDGILSTFERHGTVDSNDNVRGGAGLFINNELE